MFNCSTFLLGITCLKTEGKKKSGYGLIDLGVCHSACGPDRDGDGDDGEEEENNDDEAKAERV